MYLNCYEDSQQRYGHFPPRSQHLDHSTKLIYYHYKNFNSTKKKKNINTKLLIINNDKQQVVVRYYTTENCIYFFLLYMTIIIIHSLSCLVLPLLRIRRRSSTNVRMTRGDSRLAQLRPRLWRKERSKNTLCVW